MTYKARKEIIYMPEKDVETVTKREYDDLVKEYNRIHAAYNEALVLIGNGYIEKVSQAIFEKIDKENK